MMSKRKAEPDDELVEQPDKSAAAPIDSFAEAAGSSTHITKKAKADRTAPSKSRWDDLRTKCPQLPTFGGPDELPRDPATVTEVYLPQSFHTVNLIIAWRVLHVYGGTELKHSEAQRLKLLEPWLVPLIALFEGRLVDIPEGPLPATDVSTRGAMEHGIFFLGGALFVLIEMKAELEFADNAAQLFAELLAAYEINKGKNLGDLKIFGVLTDMISFHVFSFDPSTQKFYHNNQNCQNVRHKHEDFCYDMIKVSNMIFSILLEQYISALYAVREKSCNRGKFGDLLELGSAIQILDQKENTAQKGSTSGHTRQSFDKWDQAYLLAKAAQKLLSTLQSTVENSDKIDMESSENEWKHGLTQLQKSVQKMNHAMDHLYVTRDMNEQQVHEMADEIVRSMYKKHVHISKG